jgi:hypothetical protein
MRNYEFTTTLKDSPAQTPSGFAEIVSDDFPVLHR